MTMYALTAARKRPSFLLPVVRRYQEVRAMHDARSFNLVVGGIIGLVAVCIVGNIVAFCVTGKTMAELWTLAGSGMTGLVALLARPPAKGPEEGKTPDA